MSTVDFDAITQSVALAAPRRNILRFLVALALGLVPRHAVRAGAPTSICRPGRSRCRRGNQCCSGVCKKKGRKRRKRGTCKSLGPFAANCAPLTTCLTDGDPPPCQVGDVGGYCTGSASGEPFCVRDAFCSPGEPPACQSDKDCFAMLGPDAKCLPCSGDFCAGNVVCALYVGDPLPEFDN